MKIFFCVLSAITAYLVGGINPAILLSKAIYHKDIRTLGSHNPGFTNFKRVFGGRYAWYVFALDILKSVVPCLIFGLIFKNEFDMYQFGVSFTGLFTMIGHAYPVWYRFKGGKAFLAGAGAIWLIDYRAGLIATCIMMLVLFTTHYMSLSSICAAISCPVSLLVLGTESKAVLALCIAGSLFMIYRHKENIKKLVSGKETKFNLFAKKEKEVEKVQK